MAIDRTGAEIAKLSDDLECAAAQIIGNVVLDFSRLEFSLAMSLRNLVASTNPGDANALVERLSFKSKLDAALDIVERRFSGSPEFVAQFRAWHKRADSLRAMRNSFVHGRWGFAPSAGEVINVAPGMPGDAPQSERRMTLAALELERDQVRSVLRDFYSLSRKWP